MNGQMEPGEMEVLVKCCGENCGIKLFPLAYGKCNFFWLISEFVRSFAHTAHLFACYGLLALLAPSAELTRLLARSLRSLPRLWESE